MTVLTTTLKSMLSLPKVEVPGKQGNPSTSNMCYEKMIFWYKGDQLINMRYAY